jgi:hypothetical protein
MEIPGSRLQAGGVKLPASLLWILWMAPASCSAQTLNIGLYDYSGLSAKETLRLSETADLAFGNSGIHVVWSYCRGALAASGITCKREMKANEIVVRLQPGVPRGSSNDSMGHALVTAEGGYYASVYVPSVRVKAAGSGMAFDILLGYAVAHEAGHCMLGPLHSSEGLMRGAWNRKDAAEMSRVSLHLTKQEARKAVTRLTLAEPAAQR